MSTVENDDLDGLNKDELEEQKLRAEIRKTLVETRELQTHLWKRPVVWAAIVPLLVTAYGGWQLVRTRYFENQRAIIQLQTDDLSKRKLQLDNDIVAREQQLSAKEKEVAALELSYKTRTEKLEADFKNEKSRLEQSITGLNARLKVEREQLLERGALSSMNESIRAMQTSENASDPRSSGPLLVLIEQLEKRDEYRQRRLERVKREVENNSQKPEVRTAFAYAVYRATREPKWRDYVVQQLATALASREPSSKEARFGRTYRLIRLAGGGIWENEDKLPFVKVFLEYFRNRAQADETARQAQFALWELYSFGRVPAAPLYLIDLGGYLRAVQLARDAAMDKNLFFIDRTSSPLVFVGQHAPQALFAYGAKYFTTDSIRLPEVDATFLDRILYAKRQTLKGSTVPDTMDRQAWQNWSNQNQATVNLWLEPGLETFAQNPQLLQTELARWR